MSEHKSVWIVAGHFTPTDAEYEDNPLNGSHSLDDEELQVTYFHTEKEAKEYAQGDYWMLDPVVKEVPYGSKPNED